MKKKNDAAQPKKRRFSFRLRRKKPVSIEKIHHSSAARPAKTPQIDFQHVSLSYAGKHLLIAMPQKVITLKNGTATIPLQISSPRLLSQGTLEVMALTTSGQEAARCQLKIADLTPRTMQEQTATSP